MAGKSTEQLEYECANFLQNFGFTEYEASTFVSLLRLGAGTATDVAEVGNVPRTRVYDAVNSLHKAGLVDIQHSSRKNFTPASRESAIRKLDLQRKNIIMECDRFGQNCQPE